VLNGRKKEVIISAYGKNIDPVKIELMVREETGIDHVLLFGDCKPFCTALLFGCSPNDPVSTAVLEEGIQRVNRQLSHPEQIKKWAVLADDLSIEGGELTANLKMKRSAIAQKYKEVLETLYR
jgi:long-chain acyl-CoA synthetase